MSLSIKPKLYPYQKIGADFLARLGSALLADDVGVGKTLQAITAANILRILSCFDVLFQTSVIFELFLTIFIL